VLKDDWCTVVLFHRHQELGSNDKPLTLRGVKDTNCESGD